MNVMQNIDALVKRKLELNQRKEVCEVQEYAEEWNQLAADFDACGMANNAEDCRARWMFYRDLAPGAYIRKIEMPFAETMPKQRMSAGEMRFINVWMV